MSDFSGLDKKSIDSLRDYQLMDLAGLLLRGAPDDLSQMVAERLLERSTEIGIRYDLSSGHSRRRKA